jgi:hypothetical protein
MKPSEFKQIIKESVREAIQDELKDILLEALKTTKTQVTEHVVSKNINDVIPTADKRQAYMNVLNETAGLAPGAETIGMNTNNIFRPTGTNTAAEGSSLPPGEVDMSQIMGLLNPNK